MCLHTPLHAYSTSLLDALLISSMYIPGVREVHMCLRSKRTIKGASDVLCQGRVVEAYRFSASPCCLLRVLVFEGAGTCLVDLSR